MLVVFSLTEPSSEMQFTRQECPFSPTLVSRLAVKDATKRVQKPPPQVRIGRLAYAARTGSVSHPCLTRLGVQSCMVEKQGIITFRCNVDLRSMQRTSSRVHAHHHALGLHLLRAAQRL